KNWWFDDYYKPEASFIRISEHDLNGSFIQERFYSTGKFIILNSIKGTKDGGFILVGSSYDSLGAHQNGLDLFIMKLDSLGNLTGINGKKASKLSALNFAVYPNPASEFVTFQKINQFQEYHLQVVNLLGYEIYNSFWQNDKLNIDLSQYKAGLYLYRITDNTGAVFQGKFIKK
ncbi:MAG: T9SS type A sorting domain-containing protein, partial [Flavobacteriales bacterium]|nr:T9SS type A sorting domain-containing protein [Flavobacteriales bacterium]